MQLVRLLLPLLPLRLKFLPQHPILEPLSIQQCLVPNTLKKEERLLH
jgi:hypothetical protein